MILSGEEIRAQLGTNIVIVLLGGVFGMSLDRSAVFDRTYVHAIAFGAGRYDPWYEEGNVDYPIQHARWTENRTMLGDRVMPGSLGPFDRR